MYKQKNKVVQNCKIGVTIVIVFQFPSLFFSISCYSASLFPAQIYLFLCLFPFPWFSPYAVGDHKDESDKYQNPSSDKDARYQELGGRVMS